MLTSMLYAVFPWSYYIKAQLLLPLLIYAWLVDLLAFVENQPHLLVEILLVETLNTLIANFIALQSRRSRPFHILLCSQPIAPCPLLLSITTNNCSEKIKDLWTKKR